MYHSLLRTRFINSFTVDLPLVVLSPGYIRITWRALKTLMLGPHAQRGFNWSQVGPMYGYALQVTLMCTQG